MALDRDALLARYTRIRTATENLCAPLPVDDLIVRPSEFASPTKWHLGHATRFIEEHVLPSFLGDMTEFDPLFSWVFAPHEVYGHRTLRRLRGTMAHPSLQHIRDYRVHIDTLVQKALRSVSDARYGDFAAQLEVALQHEMVHQEALLADIKYVLFTTPGLPAYREHRPEFLMSPGDLRATEFVKGGTHTVGFVGDSFSFEDERPAHEVEIRDLRMNCHPVTNGEFMEFVEQNGYGERRYWSDEGWATLQKEQWRAPMYWLNLDGAWWEYRLDGLRPIDLVAPVCHVSYYEAEAYAKFVDKRLPTEEEWEVATHQCEFLEGGNFLESGILYPTPGRQDISAHRLLGDVWEWTSSIHKPYPGYVGSNSAHGETIGMFGEGWRVLRGGSCISPRESVRVTTRNELLPHMRWHFSGIRLAEDA